MSVLVATTDGYHIFTSKGQHLTSLEGKALTAFAPGPDGNWLGVVDWHGLWQHAPDGTWTALATADVGLTWPLAVGDDVLVGTADARVLRLTDGELVPLPGFDTAPGRDEWHQVGSPLCVRSMTATADGGTILANVHVGGIPRAPPTGASPGSPPSRSTTTSTRCRRTRPIPASWSRRRRSGCAAAPTAAPRGRRPPKECTRRTHGPSCSSVTTCSSACPTVPSPRAARSIAVGLGRRRPQGGRRVARVARRQRRHRVPGGQRGRSPRRRRRQRVGLPVDHDEWSLVVSGMPGVRAVAVA
ncbi:MAG: hypothetical protein U0W40_07350 [Acidimicrobiia bacterium]